MANYDSDVVAEGALTTEASLYSPGVGAYLANGCLALCNTGSNDRVVSVWVTKASGTKRLIANPLLGPTSGQYSYDISGIHLGPSDDLRAAQDAGTDVTYVLMGGSGA